MSRHLSAVIIIGFYPQKTKVLLRDLASWCNDLAWSHGAKKKKRDFQVRADTSSVV